eukprot:TRINITY_DN268_c0_g1_i7.p4 TRINITY_DN268_c0_g1~~TRINITY_DN268_c0_g1_i7.p4  ORF type:complete len:137 (-),score=3.80 TRINITY_DN268_c0_g1_i7:235-645(-)
MTTFSQLYLEQQLMHPLLGYSRQMANFQRLQEKRSLTQDILHQLIPPVKILEQNVSGMIDEQDIQVEIAHVIQQLIVNKRGMIHKRIANYVVFFDGQLVCRAPKMTCTSKQVEKIGCIFQVFVDLNRYNKVYIILS